MKQIWNNFLDTLFPKDIKCICCGKELFKENRYCVCEDCLKSLPRTTSHICLKCGESLDSMADYCLSCKDHVDRNFTIARSPLVYDGVVVKLVHDIKYNNKQFLGEYLSRFLVDEYIKNKMEADYVVPIPLNENRLKQRGYNQAYIISVSFEKELNMIINTTNLIRTVDTPTQTALSKQERKKNLEDAFTVVDKTLFKGKKILLIDDVYTTGATMEEASKALLKSGASEVYCLTLAHTMPSFMRISKQKD